MDEYLPKLKELPGAQITRQVCGGCLDFKVSITQPLGKLLSLFYIYDIWGYCYTYIYTYSYIYSLLEEHGAWAEADYGPLEEEFLGKLNSIDGVSQVETQEITFEAL